MGDLLGRFVGDLLGDATGARVGDFVGFAVGRLLGEDVGAALGASQSPHSARQFALTWMNLLHLFSVFFLAAQLQPFNVSRAGTKNRSLESSHSAMVESKGIPSSVSSVHRSHVNGQFIWASS